MAARAGFLLARLYIAVFVVLTAGYCLLAYIPFTYHQVVLGALLPWLSLFARFHPYFYWGALAAAAATLPWRHARIRTGCMFFMTVYGPIGLLLLFKPLLTGLENNVQSLQWCIFAFTPIAWLGVLDWMAESSRLKPAAQPATETRHLFRACLLAAAYSWLFSSILIVVRYGVVAPPGFGSKHWILPWAVNLLSHLLFFAVIFLAANFTGAVAGLVSESLLVQSLFFVGFGAALLMQALKLIVFTPLSFSGGWANLVAFAAAVSLVLFGSGITLRLCCVIDGQAQSPLALLLSPLMHLSSRSKVLQAAILAAATAVAAWVLVVVATRDWEYLVQELVVVAIWTGAFSFFYMISPGSKKAAGDSLVIGAAVLVCLYVASVPFQPKWPVGNDTRQSLDEYAGYDVSFRLARTVLSPPVIRSDQESFYNFLVRNTNIARSIRTEPADIDLAGKLTETSGPKPNIFIFVIDSLRRDYLYPYNPAVGFTPGIAAFARESTVAENAFTRYTGTGLSEPSIWTGTMLLHKQYVTPFYPMNSLQKLLQFEHYRQFVTKDEILHTILAPSELLSELDAGRPTMSCELCRTLDELQARIREAGAGSGPLFAYSQPQNLHVSVINREGRSVPPGETYPGFDAAYASRVKALDKCFGDFIQFLKSSGLYDRSIVVLTADHGDSLGERGLWGHAYNVVPEVVRVPLIIHLPAAMKSMAFDSAAPSFVIDITPSLYYLLGHHPIVRNDLFGRPLFTEMSQEAAGYLRNSYVVASSYGPVYGLLENSGHSLYVADAVNYDDHLFAWAEGTEVNNNTVTPEIREDGQRQIREYVGEIARFFNFADVTSH